MEEEEKARGEISAALLSLDSENKLEVFAKLEHVDAHLKTLTEDEQLTYYNFDLMVLDYNLVPAADWEAKLAALRSKNSVENASLCFTAFDNVQVSRKHIHQLHARNIFYRPFDPLILRESLNMAMKFNTTVTPIEMKPQVTNSKVAILKEVELVSICELGFITMNERAIEKYSFSKYMSPLFKNDKKLSVWAQCILSVEMPNKPGVYINKFQFVGIESGALMHLRKHLQENKHKKAAGGVWNLQSTGSDKKVNIAIVDVKDEKMAKVKSDLESRFSNVKVDAIILDPRDSKPVGTHYDFVINLALNLNPKDFKRKFSAETRHFLMAGEAINEEKLERLQPFYSDIFTHPLDKSYFYKKLKIFFQDLDFAEVPDMLNIATGEKLKALNMVKINEICELYINFLYYRELELETSREFAFISEDETQMVELPGFCNFKEKIKHRDEKNNPVYMHQFIFWGMTDHYLKQIRIWLLSNYIQKKQ